MEPGRARRACTRARSTTPSAATCSSSAATRTPTAASRSSRAAAATLSRRGRTTRASTTARTSSTGRIGRRTTSRSTATSSRAGTSSSSASAGARRRSRPRAAGPAAASRTFHDGYPNMTRQGRRATGLGRQRGQVLERLCSGTRSRSIGLTLNLGVRWDRACDLGARGIGAGERRAAGPAAGADGHGARRRDRLEHDHAAPRRDLRAQRVAARRSRAPATRCSRRSSTPIAPRCTRVGDPVLLGTCTTRPSTSTATRSPTRTSSRDFDGSARVRPGQPARRQPRPSIGDYSTPHDARAHLRRRARAHAATSASARNVHLAAGSPTSTGSTIAA